MDKKIIVISLLFIITFTFISGCNKSEPNNMNSSKSIDKKSINSISKSTVINILKAEYGDDIIVKEEDIRLEGDLYLADVYIELQDCEDEESCETHTHRQSLGTQKIDKYTGEIINE